MRRHTCDKCKHYTPCPHARYPHDGDCALMADSNDVEVREPDRAYGWDYEGYRAGVYVGHKFGCIHWTKREIPTLPKSQINQGVRA